MTSKSTGPGGRPPLPVAPAPARPLRAWAVPPPGVPYPLTLRGPGHTWWRSAAGVVAALVLYFAVTQLVASMVLGAGYLLQRPGGSLAEYTAAGYRFEDPVGMLAQNLAIAAVIPLTWLLVTAVHQIRPRWLSSVQPRLRWRYLLLCTLVAAVVLNGVTLATGPPGTGTETQQQLVAFLVVVVLTAPLQAAAEEYLFRGYLLQALGSLVANPWFGVVVSATLFAALHGSQNLPLFLNRLAFGLLAAALVLTTGGLEAGIAAHVVNNVSAYTIALFTSSVADLRAVRSISWVESGVGTAAFALFAAAALLLARRLQLRTTTPAPAGGAR